MQARQLLCDDFNIPVPNHHRHSSPFSTVGTMIKRMRSVRSIIFRPGHCISRGEMTDVNARPDTPKARFFERAFEEVRVEKNYLLADAAARCAMTFLALSASSFALGRSFSAART